MRLRLVAKNTNWDFFGKTKMSLAVSAILLIVSLISFLMQGLNFGIDFRGGTTIRTQSAQMVDVAAYRSALGQLNLGDVTISEVYDPSFQDDQNVAMIRIQAQDGEESVSADIIQNALAALQGEAPDIAFVSVESVGPKVSGELVQTAALAVILAIVAVLIYIWLRFEWQFALGAVAVLVHDVLFEVPEREPFSRTSNVRVQFQGL